MNKFSKISLFFLFAITSMASLQAKPNKQQITFSNKSKQDLSIQVKWRMRNAPHTQRLQDVSVSKNKNITIKAPISGYDIEEMTAYYTKGINDAMKKSQKSHGNTYFIIKAGSRYKNDSGEKRRHLKIEGYPNEKDYKQKTATQAEAAKATIAQAMTSSTKPRSYCADGSIGSCYDGTAVKTLSCSEKSSPDINGMCADLSLAVCPDGYYVSCDDGSDPIAGTAPVVANTPVTGNAVVQNNVKMA